MRTTLPRGILTLVSGFQNFSCVSELLWFVAHTKPRREKKLASFCKQKGISVTLPFYKSAHKYRGKTVVFQKPLFPGYVFLRIPPLLRQTVLQSDHVANLLDVFDQNTFEAQLGEILLALDTDLDVRVAPSIGKGMRVRVKSGPLRGIEGWVEERYGMDTVLLRLDFISQAAAVKVGVDSLELT